MSMSQHIFTYVWALFEPKIVVKSRKIGRPLPQNHLGGVVRFDRSPRHICRDPCKSTYYDIFFHNSDSFHAVKTLKNRLFTLPLSLPLQKRFYPCSGSHSDRPSSAPHSNRFHKNRTKTEHERARRKSSPISPVKLYL